MSTEIERKFLLSEQPPAISEHEGRRIDQGYIVLSGETEVRIRIVDSRDQFLTVKRGKGEIREEVEIPLTPQQHAALWPLTDSLRIAKTRHELPLDEGLTADVDVYAGDLEGLRVAEVEFESLEAAERFRPPDWLGREVTGDERFANASLARDGRPADAS